MMTLPFQRQHLNADLVGLIDQAQNTQDIVLAYDILYFVYKNFSLIDQEYYVELQFLEMPDFEHTDIAVDVPEPRILSYVAPLQALVEMLELMVNGQPLEDDIKDQLEAFHKAQSQAREAAVLCLGQDIESVFSGYLQEFDDRIEYEDSEGKKLNKAEMTLEEKEFFNPLRMATKDLELISTARAMPAAYLHQLITFSNQVLFIYVQEGDQAAIPLKYMRLFPHMFKHPKLQVVALGDIGVSGEEDHLFNNTDTAGEAFKKNEVFLFGYEGLEVAIGKLVANFAPTAS